MNIERLFYIFIPLVLILFLSYLFSLKLTGIPNGVDSAAHVFRVLYLYENFKNDVVPLWNSLWYAGSPFLLLYGPLAFYLTMPLAFLVGPIAAYKIIEILFLLLSAVSIYFLTKKVTKDKKVSFIAAFLFIISPFVIFNFSVVDRFATIVEEFFFIFSLYFLISLYEKTNLRTSVFLGIFSGLTFLSQGFGFLVLLILFIFFLLIKRSFQSFKYIFLSLLIVFAISLPWLFPASQNFVYNILHPYTAVWTTRTFFDLPRIAGTFFVLGFPALILLALKFKFVQKLKNGLILLLIIFMFLGFFLYQVKYNLTYEIFVVCSLLTILLLFTKKFNFKFNKQLDFLFWISLILVFLSVSLPLYAFTFLRIIDPYRVSVLAVIPIAILISYILKQNKIGILIVTTVFLIISSTFLTTVWVKGIEIDQNLIEKLKSAPEGRILAPEPPSWIHFLPVLSNKSSIDGMCPFEKLIPEFRQYRHSHFGLWFDDVTIEQRNKIYSSLITNSEKYGIKYVIFAKNSKFVMPNVNYTLLYSSKEFDVYMLDNEVDFIEGGKMKRPNPNTIIVYPSEENILIKEAFAPGWKTSCGTISSNLDGFIALSGDCKEMVLTYKPTIFDVRSILWFK